MPRRKIVELRTKDGRPVLVSRQMVRYDIVKTPSGQQSKRWFLTIPRVVGKIWDEWGVEMVEVYWLKDNPTELRIIPLKTQRLVAPQQQQQQQQQNK
jgi:hypothetical protein